LRKNDFAGLLLVGTALVATSASAENYNFEVDLAFQSTQSDGEQTITTAAGTIFNSTDSDADDLSLVGNWYFAGLSDEKGPRARAAFVDRASVLSFGYARVDLSTSATVVSTDPLVPSFSGDFETDGDVYALDVRYVWRDSGWFGNAGVASSDVTLGGFVQDSINSTAWRLGFGKYLWDTTSLALDVSQSDDDGGDVTMTAVSFSHLGDMGERWQYAVDLGFRRAESGVASGLDQDTWSAALSLYPTRDFEFGVRVDDVDAESAFFDRTGVEGFASWFVTPRVVLAASYRVDDVNFVSNVVRFPSAQTSSDADQDSVGISVSVRF